MELWDAYYKDGTRAGCDLVRGEPVPDGLCYIICEVLVRHMDGDFLLMQRDWNKKGHPGLFEASASGALLKGETPHEGALRELREETGIVAQALTPLGISLNKTQTALFYSFFCVTGCDKASVTLQEGETISYRWLPKDEFLAFIETDQFIDTQRDRLEPYLCGIR